MTSGLPRTWISEIGFECQQNRPVGPVCEALLLISLGRAAGVGSARHARTIRASVRVPVLVTGAFQSADVMSRALRSGACDGVTIARALLANPDLPNLLAEGRVPEAPCTFCNKCVGHVIENPLGCYEDARFVGRGGREELIRQVMSIFESEA